MADLDFTNVSALSVDLFDTLLLRAVADPAGVFRHVGSLAAARGEVRAHVTPAQFHAIRRGAEDQARLRRRAEDGSTEVTLVDIYSAVPAGILAACPAALAATEIDTERELVYPHPGTLDHVLAARAKGLRTAILSDTFYSADEVRQLLQAAGVDPTLFSEILTSCDERVSKRDGGLFARLLGRWPDLEPDAILHVGDNPRADVMRARAAGLRAVAHDTGEDALRGTIRLEQLRHGTPAPELVSLRRLAVSLAAPIQDEERWWFTLGASVLGPLLSAFADWIVRDCARDGITVVRPLMREGGLLAPMLAHAADSAGIDLDVQPLYASRASTWLASITAFDTGSARRLLQRQQLTVAEAFATLGLRISSAPDTLRDAAATRLEVAATTTTASGVTLEDEILAYLERADVRVEIDYHAARARRLVSQYISQECGSTGSVALVDIGFQGTTGLRIERAVVASDRRVHQFLLFGKDSVQQLWQRGHDVRVYAAGPDHHADFAGLIARYPAVLEAVLMEGGTTLGYRLSGDRVVPVLDESLVPETQRALVAACRRGIAAFQDRWLDWRLLRSQAADAVVSAPRALIEPLHRLLTMPTSEEASRLGALVHEDNDGGLSARTISESLWPAGRHEEQHPGATEREWRQIAGTVDGAPPAIPAVAMKVREAGVRRCIVWGAGEAGIALVRACRVEGIEVPAVTDSDPALWGSAIEGVPVVSPEEARRQGADVYAIGSLAFASDIELALRRRYIEASQPVRIFSATNEVAA